MPLSGVLAVPSANCGLPDSGDRPVAASSHEVEDAAESVVSQRPVWSSTAATAAASVSANGRFI